MLLNYKVTLRNTSLPHLVVKRYQQYGDFVVESTPDTEERRLYLVTYLYIVHDIRSSVARQVRAINSILT